MKKTLLFGIFLFIALFYIVCCSRREHFSCNRREHFSDLKICIVMIYTDNIKSYSQITEKINRKYAQKYNYDIIVERQRLASDRAPQWDKVRAVSKHLPNYDYVFWIDSDAIFSNHNIRLEKFINLGKDYNILICDDKPNGGYINTGAMYFKNTKWTRDFLKTWWDIGNNSEYNYKFAHEQTILKTLLMSNKYSAKDNTKIFAVNDFNSNYPSQSTHTDKEFILHLMAAPEQERIDTFTKYYNKICG